MGGLVKNKLWQLARWNVRNSGVMIHSQSAQSVGINWDFPVSAEVYFWRVKIPYLDDYIITNTGT
jgi:hypothetical protein